MPQWKDSFNSGRTDGSGFILQFPRLALRNGTGEHMGAGTGSSLEFQDFREYRPGDDIRRLDWSAYARTDRLMLRLFRNEVQPKIDVCTDFSASMVCPDYSKALAALYLSGLFLETGLRSSAAVAWRRFEAYAEPILPYSMNLPESPEIPEFDTRGASESSLAALRGFAGNSMRIVISDFLWPEPPAPMIRHLSESASALLLLCLLSEEELNPPLYGAATLIDAENDTACDTLVDTQKRENYRKRLNTHLELWRSDALALGASFQILPLKGETEPYPDLSPLLSSGILGCI